jgi:hypothetical protein
MLLALSVRVSLATVELNLPRRRSLLEGCQAVPNLPQLSAEPPATTAPSPHLHFSECAAVVAERLARPALPPPGLRLFDGFRE